MNISIFIVLFFLNLNFILSVEINVFMTVYNKPLEEPDSVNCIIDKFENINNINDFKKRLLDETKKK